MTDKLIESLAAAVLQRFVEEGLDASYMSDEEIANQAAKAVVGRLEQAEARLAELEGFTRRGMGLLRIWRGVDHEVVANTARIQTDAYLKAAKEVLGKDA